MPTRPPIPGLLSRRHVTVTNTTTDAIGFLQAALILDTGQSDRCRHRGRWLGASWSVVGVDDFVAGVGFGDDVVAVVDVVVTQGAGETQGVDVC